MIENVILKLFVDRTRPLCRFDLSARIDLLQNAVEIDLMDDIYDDNEKRYDREIDRALFAENKELVRVYEELHKAQYEGDIEAVFTKADVDDKRQQDKHKTEGKTGSIVYADAADGEKSDEADKRHNESEIEPFAALKDDRIFSAFPRCHRHASPSTLCQ